MQRHDGQSRYGQELRFGYLRPRPHRLAASQDCWASGHAVRIVRTGVFAAGVGHHRAFVGRPCHDLVMCGPVQGHRQNQNKQDAPKHRHHALPVARPRQRANTRPSDDLTRQDGKIFGELCNWDCTTRHLCRTDNFIALLLLPRYVRQPKRPSPGNTSSIQ
jgi:hypothetical protein